ncbi:methylitaconate delta2-delta3-isomerase [Nocardioides rotundus]|uniref:PrpF domain-containing protein n=1 Tax=Nocardioides rotundus TaxID=1774216 RepID=UPI001CBE81D6|nr:PrpF domain-containing protein [Nocardioides rotundus]UAL29428.1 methylitaconate delta2-delta3-isomerase [Nocardioides rotundus]
MREIPATWMRGGTSKCWVFRREDLDVPGLTVDEVLLRLYGSPDARQVDGVGGGTSTTSKAVILSRSSEPGVDVDYLFGQVGIEDATVDWGSNCGNCSAVVAAFAIREGWVATESGDTTVRVRNANTGQLIVQEVPTPGGVLSESPEAANPGVPFGGVPVRLGFVDPAGRSTGRLLPTGSSREEIDGLTVTLLDAGAPVVLVPATQLGLTGIETPARLEATPGLLSRLDDVRRQAAVRMGLAETPQLAQRAVPKLALIAAPASADADLEVRMLSMGRVHPAVPITGSVAITMAARTPGTVVADVTSAETGLRLHTPAGTVETFVDHHDGAPVVGVVRTYRRLATGAVVLPDVSAEETTSLQHRDSPMLAVTGGKA